MPVNKFEKVSFDQWKKCFACTDMADNTIEETYNEIALPRRSTKLSAGYDFKAPFEVYLAPDKTVTIPTGIRVLLDADKFLAIYPRSGLGFKYRLGLANTVGVVDAGEHV